MTPSPPSFYKHWYKSKKKAFTRYAKKFAEAPQEIDSELERIKKYCQVVRVIAHTQVRDSLQLHVRGREFDIFTIIALARGPRMPRT